MPELARPTPRRIPTATRTLLALLAVLAVMSAAACSSSEDPAPVAAPTTVAAAPRLPSGSSSHEIRLDTGTRTYRTYVPASLDRSKPAPLVMMLHGGFGSGAQAESAYGWNGLADDAGFIIVYPDGLGNGRKHDVARSWNAGTCCGIAARDDVDDVVFLAQLVESLARNNAIDPRRRFVAGMSNGAMMAQRMACETRLFAAMASVAGAQMVPCDTAEPTSTIFIHGTADTRVPPDGSPGDGIGRVPEHPPLDETVTGWVRRNSCDDATNRENGPVAITAWTCADGRGVERIVVDGAGHQWPGSQAEPGPIRKAMNVDEPSQVFYATGAIWGFFSAHPAPE